MSKNEICKIAEQMEKLLVDSRIAGEREHLRKMARSLVDLLGGEHYVPTIQVRLTGAGNYEVSYCPYCYRRHRHPSNTTRHVATCGRGEYILEVEGE